MKEKPLRKGRWCFGNLNSVAGRLNAHYLFLACTPFLYGVGDGQEYHVDAIYDHQEKYIGIWVDGKRVALESRYLPGEDMCHQSLSDWSIVVRYSGVY